MERRFWLLRRLSRLLGIVAWVVLGLVALIVPVGLARALLARSADEAMQTLAFGASGGLIFISMIYLAQWIQVILAIEENTKHAGYVLERLATLTQQVRDRLGEAPGREAGTGGSEPTRRSDRGSFDAPEEMS